MNNIYLIFLHEYKTSCFGIQSSNKKSKISMLLNRRGICGLQDKFNIVQIVCVVFNAINLQKMYISICLYTFCNSLFLYVLYPSIIIPYLLCTHFIAFLMKSVRCAFISFWWNLKHLPIYGSYHLIIGIILPFFLCL